MLNRFISIVLAALMLSSLVGCGTKTPISSNEEVLMETDDTFMPEENSENSDGVENSQESPDTEVLTNEELAALAETGDIGEICRAITTAEDCTQLIAVSGLEEGDNGSIESAFTKKLLTADQIIELVCQILDGDYEELDAITTAPDNYSFLYVKQDGKYGIYDVLKAAQTDQGESGVVCDSIEAMIQYTTAHRDESSATMKTWPW